MSVWRPEQGVHGVGAVFLRTIRQLRDGYDRALRERSNFIFVSRSATARVQTLSS